MGYIKTMMVIFEYRKTRDATSTLPAIAMKANEYELLLRKIYFPNSAQKQDNSTQLYLTMQQEYGKLSLNREERNLQDEFQFRKSFLMVRNYVQLAINDGLKNLKVNMGIEDVAKLSYMAAMLNRNFFDKPSLDQIIIKANSVFKHYN